MRPEPTVPDLLERARREGAVGPPPQPKDIETLGVDLALTLPPTYRELLAAASWIRHPNLILCGIAPDDPELDARTRTLADRDAIGLWPGLLRISDDGGDYAQFLVADPSDELYGCVVTLPEGVRQTGPALPLADDLLVFMQYAIDP